MLIIIKINDDTTKRIMDIINSNKGVLTLNEFVNIAIQNQLEIEESNFSIDDLLKSNVAIHESKFPEKKIGMESQIMSTDISSPKSTDSKLIKDIYEDLLKISNAQPKILEFKNHIGEDSKLPLWGMNNRIAPVKFSLRILASLLNENNSSWVAYHEVQNHIENVAPRIKDYLDELDELFNRKRGEKLSVAFPSDDRNSIKRFLNQYLGSISKKTKSPGGLLHDLCFISLREKNDGRIEIGLTEYGWKFCELMSPLLDIAVGKANYIENPLSEDELRFLVNHLAKCRPGELEFLRQVAKLVKSGINSPPPLTDSVENYLKDIGYEPLTKAVVTTMRVGAISKLTELGVVSIDIKKGESHYSISDINYRLLEGLE